MTISKLAASAKKNITRMIKNLILIFLSILILSFSITEFGLMFISIPTFLLLSYNLSDLLLNIFKKKLVKKTGKNFELIMLIGVIALIFVIRDFEYTIGGYNLFWKLSFLSLIFNVIFISTLNLKYNFENKKKFENIVSISIFWFFIIPSLGMLLNKYVDLKLQRTEIKYIKSKEITKNTRSGDLEYRIYIKTKFDDKERLEITQELYDSEYENVQLTLKRGILGYEYVTKIEGK